MQVKNMSILRILPCLDSEQMAASRRQELTIPRGFAAALGRSAVEAAREGLYVTKAGQKVVWRDVVEAACAAKQSIDPEVTLPSTERIAFTETRVQVTNETTFGA
jgi:hypothetical protein